MFSSTITSFLAYPMSSMSGHKTQGNTLDKLIVGSWGKYKYGTKGWLYVVLSRVSDLDHIFLIEKLSTDPKKFLPRKNILLEMKRIRKITQKTMLNLNKLKSL